MKATGVVRRLDDLGRIVIPKEIRKNFRIKEGDNIEFYIEKDHIVIQKYNTLDAYKEELTNICNILTGLYGLHIIFVEDEIVPVSDLSIVDSFAKRIVVHSPVAFDSELVYCDDSSRYDGMIFPVCSYGDYFGSFIMFDCNDKDVDPMLINAFCEYLVTKLVR
ncbi:MAG: AbrB/MazE/SpoVT family DNA-binding domain-containing protein [Erysipelotrichaceae bacterium]